MLIWKVGVGVLPLTVLAGGWLAGGWLAAREPSMGGRQSLAQPLKTIVVGHQATGIAVDDRAGRAAVINTGDDSVSIVDTQRGIVVTTVGGISHGSPSTAPLHLPLVVAMDSRTGRTFVAGSGGNMPGFDDVSILDTRLGRILRSVPIPGAVRGIAINERIGRVFILTDVAFPKRGGIGNVTVFDSRSGIVLHTVPVGVHPVWIAVDRHAGRVLVVNQGMTINGLGTVSVLDAAARSTIRTVAVGQRPMAVAVDEGTSHAFTTNNGGSVSMLDTAYGRVAATTNVASQPDAVGVDAVAHHAFVTTLGTNSVAMLDTRTGALLRIVPVGIRPMVVAVDTRAHRALIGNNVSGTVTVLNSVTGMVVDTVAVDQNPADASVDERTKHAFIVNRSINDARPTRWEHFVCLARALFGRGCPDLLSHAMSRLGSVSMLDTAR